MKISKELLQDIEEIDNWLQKYFSDLKQSKKERIYARSVKLNEEVWELMSEVLSFFNDQRKVKLSKASNRDDLKKEFWDVLLTTLLLAKSMKIDINEALNITIKKVKKRFKEE